MTEKLCLIYNSLIDIKKYLIKSGKKRFTGNIIENKLNECEKLISSSNLILENIKYSKKSDIINKAIEIYENINVIYLEIKKLCIKSESYSTKMDFDLKTACSLLPVMDGVEETTKKLIDGIEMYADMLKDSDFPLLIKFILKSRLSENAKMRMLTDYTSVKDIVKDMKIHLLTKKSFTAIQARLQQTTQGWRSVEEYGSEIEKLFTELTISQADGNTSNYSVLKPLNEKSAIKQFSDGLKNSKLSTIIAARNYSSLKDAIQAAKDEEIFLPSTSTNSEIMHIRRSSARGKRGFQGRYNNFYNRYPTTTRGHNRRGYYNNKSFSRDKYYNRGNQQHHQHSNRGQFSRDTKRSNRNVFPINTNNTVSEPIKKDDVDQFFRI